ncbi:MAG: alkane 1-monooxygenase [Chitinophagales bacterium]|nr:alkane 1-monooxygenase [Chitinophagales bacterium]
MKWRTLKFFIPIVVLPAILVVSLNANGWWTFFAVAFGFVFIPAVELFLPGNEDNLSLEEEKEERNNKLYDYLIYFTVIVQFVGLFYFLYRVGYTDYTTLELIGMTWSMSIGCGVIGINVAHELGHRSKKYEQNMSKALLLTSLYMHFFIEHNRGHHKNIATRFDPATSRKNEVIYSFFIRSVVGGWLSAWKLEAHRLKKSNQVVISIHNEMLVFQMIQVLFCTMIAIVFGWKAMLAFIGAAVLGFLLLETVNYIEHYGLLRKEISEGRFEKVKPHHSWNTNRTLGRLFLFELTRHSDHHYNASRKYQILRHFDNAPQMPNGYPAMMICALFPPLWFYIMNPIVDQHNNNINEDYSTTLGRNFASA